MSRARILVVEDESIVAMDIQERLETLGYEVPATAASGLKAIECAEHLRPDLVLMDIRLQGDMDGVEAAAEIRYRFDIPVVYLTANADHPTVERAKVTEPFGYILKPFEERDLHTTIEIALYKHQAERKLRESEQWLWTTLNSIGEAVIATDQQGVITFMNPLAEKLTGWLENEAKGKELIEVFSLLHEETHNPTVSPAAVIDEAGAAGLKKSAILIARDGIETPIDNSAAPIHDNQGKVVGAVLVFRDITERKRAEERLMHDAFHDGLTGLPNRSLFMDHLTLAVERGRRHPHCQYAVLFLDLDRFKIVNDSLGHLLGDKVLISTAERLKSCLRPGDTVARLGGDEFTVLLEGINTSEAIEVAERLQRELSIPFNVGEREVFTTVSIGIAPGRVDYSDPAEVLRDADTAMYRAKTLGKARYAVFDKPMHASMMSVLELETGLRRSVERNEFVVHYQPIIRLDTGTITGFEALLRWQNPDRGLMMPNDFIQVAEETGLITSIGKWVLGETCRQLDLWQKQFPQNPPLQMAVNLSVKQLTPDLIAQVEQVLQESGIDPSSLNLEITETTMMENIDMAIDLLNQLRGLGVELSIDDFGTGYSSLSYLRRFPVSFLKIDRSFISRMNDNSENLEIVRTITSLARGLGLSVVAEGIETEAQLEKLRAFEIQCGQGYLFSAPVDADGVVQLLSDTAMLGLMSSAPCLQEQCALVA